MCDAICNYEYNISNNETTTKRTNQMRKMTYDEYVSNECIKFRDNYLLNDELSFRIFDNKRIQFFDICNEYDIYELNYIERTNRIFNDFMNFDFELSYFDFDANDETIIYAYECDIDISHEMTKLKFKYENDKLSFIEKMIDDEYK